MKKRIIIISMGCAAVLTLLLSLPRHAEPSKISQISQTPVPEVKASQTTVPKAKTPASESNPDESFYDRNKDYIESLPKASVHVLKTFTKEPKRELVNLPNVGEVIKITFEDGSVGYEPNIPTYDISNGTFGPKPF